MMHSLISRTLFALVVTLAVATTPVAAQCFGPDGLSVPGACCQVVTPNLPTFTQAAIPSEYACLLDCSPELIEPCNILIGAPIALFCDTYVIGLTVSGTLLVPTVPTFMIAKYSRTWIEVDASGNPTRQVWRFLINIDLNFNITPVTSTPCPIPPCHGLGANPLDVHFVGSLDYVQPCNVMPVPPARPGAINLTHMCGRLTHAPFSARPLPAAMSHPNRSYAFAGPTPFAWGPAPTPMGPVVAGAQRSTLLDLPNVNMVCLNENRVLQGQVQDVMQDCLCGSPPTPTTAPPIWHHQDINFTYLCQDPLGGAAFNFSPIPFPPLLPTGIACMNLGTYLGVAGGGAYPAQESVSVYVGIASAPDPCQNWWPFHVVHGVGTSGGAPGILLDGPMIGPMTGNFVNEFIDLENSLLFDGSAPGLISVGLGSIYFSNQVWQLNTP